MSFDSLMAAAQRLSVSVEALAALGAQLRLQQDGLEGDPRVRALLNEIARAVDPQLLEDVDEHQQATCGSSECDCALKNEHREKPLDLASASGLPSVTGATA